MIQELMSSYVTDILIGYIKAGLIGWAIWIVAAIVYVLMSFGTNLSLYRTEEKGGKKKLSLRGILTIVIWPWGMMYLTHELVKDINTRLYGKE